MKRDAASPTYTPELGLRLQELVAALGGPGKVGAWLDVKGETVTKWARGDSKAPFAALSAIARRAGVSLDWLAYGVGPKERGARLDEHQVPYGAGGPAPEGFVLVPRYDVRVSAGPGAIVGDENVRDWLAFRQDFIRRELGADPANVFSFDAVGDSMEPTIKHGDTLTFVRITGALPSDGIFALGIGDALVVKRVQPVLGGLMLLSDNPAYKAETLSLEEAREVRALGRLKVISRVL